VCACVCLCVLFVCLCVCVCVCVRLVSKTLKMLSFCALFLSMRRTQKTVQMNPRHYKISIKFPLRMTFYSSGSLNSLRTE
jgi:hypothetical protein